MGISGLLPLLKPAGQGDDSAAIASKTNEFIGYVAGRWTNNGNIFYYSLFHY